jgi:hypothetical protein
VTHADGAPPPIGEEAAPPATDDPESSAQLFVERNQREALAHLQALSAEAEKLRTRLTKLESGIKRWQGLVNALKSAQASSDEPVALEAMPQASVGRARSDKRVKWTSASPAPPQSEAPPAVPVTEEPAPPPATPTGQPAAPALQPR